MHPELSDAFLELAQRGVAIFE